MTSTCWPSPRQPAPGWPCGSWGHRTGNPASPVALVLFPGLLYNGLGRPFVAVPVPDSTDEVTFIFTVEQALDLPFQAGFFVSLNEAVAQDDVLFSKTEVELIVNIRQAGLGLDPPVVEDINGDNSIHRIVFR